MQDADVDRKAMVYYQKYLNALIQKSRPFVYLRQAVTRSSYLETGKSCPVQFVPETLHVDDLFKSMKKSRDHFAVVVDEYGGVDGIVTMNDLLEELVGELEDDMTAPPSRPDIEKLEDDVWQIKGCAAINDVADALKINLSDTECDTFGGFVMSLMESIPENKTDIKLYYENLEIKVVETKGHRIETTQVRFCNNNQINNE